jgi:hypothetical protein
MKTQDETTHKNDQNQKMENKKEEKFKKISWQGDYS